MFVSMPSQTYYGDEWYWQMLTKRSLKMVVDLKIMRTLQETFFKDSQLSAGITLVIKKLTQV